MAAREIFISERMEKVDEEGLMEEHILFFSPWNKSYRTCHNQDYRLEISKHAGPAPDLPPPEPRYSHLQPRPKSKTRQIIHSLYHEI